MSNPVPLTDAEVRLVSGGLVSGGRVVLVQANVSSITQTATATNSGPVTARSGGPVVVPG